MKLITTLLTCSILIISSGFQSANQWLGRWEYSESWQSLAREVHNSVVYILNIRQEDGNIVADLNLDGYQTLRRIGCQCRMLKDGIQIVFAASREGDTGKTYSKSDVLLELNMQKGKIITSWGAIKPQLDSHQKADVYFYKVEQQKGRRAK